MTLRDHGPAHIIWAIQYPTPSCLSLDLFAHETLLFLAITSPVIT